MKQDEIVKEKTDEIVKEKTMGNEVPIGQQATIVQQERQGQEHSIARLVPSTGQAEPIVSNEHPLFYVMKLGVHDKVYNEAVEDFDPKHMTEYIQYYFPKGGFAIKSLPLVNTNSDQLVIVYRKDPQVVAQEQAAYEAQQTWAAKALNALKPVGKSCIKLLTIGGKGLLSAVKMLLFTANRVSGGGTHVITFRHQVAQLERSHFIGGEPVSERYNTLASKLVGIDVCGEAFLCCIAKNVTNDMADTYDANDVCNANDIGSANGMQLGKELHAFNDSVRQDIEQALNKIFEHQRTIEFVPRYTVRRLVMKTKETEAVFTNAIRHYLGDMETLKVEYNKINADGSWDMHYRSKSGNYFIACNQDDRRENVLVSIFKRVDSLDSSIDKVAREKLEYNEALEILNGRFGNVRVATSKMLEEIVKAYLNEHGYEYKKAIPLEEFDNPQDYTVFHSRDHVYVTPYGETYYASVELTDNTWLHIDMEEGRKTVHMEVYREALRKLYDGSNINYEG